MFSINYKHNNYRRLIHDIASRVEVPVRNGVLQIPDTLGDGYFKQVKLANGFQCLITDIKFNKQTYVHQQSDVQEFYTLRFNERSTPDKVVLKIDNEYLWEVKRQTASVLLTSSLYDFDYMVSKDTSIKSINFLVPKRWLLKYIPFDDADNLVRKYLMRKTGDFNFATFDDEYHNLFNRIFCKGYDKNIEEDINNDLMLMIAKFVRELIPKLNSIKETEKVKISIDEVKRLMIVESCLTKDFSITPPSISCLSKVAAMSTTSLKTKFKKLYGTSLYEYFQNCRMQHAKVLMLTRKYSIKEIGLQLGYSNLSNFSIAFKKQFKHLPSRFLLSLGNS
jgi:AraC-like DNA-binding protein